MRLLLLFCEDCRIQGVESAYPPYGRSPVRETRALQFSLLNVYSKIRMRCRQPAQTARTNSRCERPWQTPGMAAPQIQILIIAEGQA